MPRRPGAGPDRGAPACAAAAAFLILAGFVPAPAYAPPADRSLPALVFVSRQPPRGAQVTQLPGFGPVGRALVTGGRLLVRERDGRVRSLLPEGAFFDVSDPSVSWDGMRVAFAATPAPDSAWRIWVIGRDGGGLTAVTREDADIAPAAGGRADDFDPCWLPDGRLCFASTRSAGVAELAGLPVTNLWAVHADGTGLRRITSDRNGAEEPGVDPATGRVVYARWWFNRYRALDHDAFGITTDSARAVAADAVNLWHAISVQPDGDGGRLAGGDTRERTAQEAYQPVVLAGGTLVGVAAAHAALEPAAGPTRLVAFPGGIGPARWLTGPGTRNPGSALAPAALPDGRIVFALDPNGRGDYGLYVMKADGSRLARVLDLPGTLELDAAVLAPRPRPPVVVAQLEAPPARPPDAGAEELRRAARTFRFDCLNVFANAPVDAPFPDAPPLQRDVRIRFYAALARPGAEGGDTLVLVREAAVEPSGAVHQDGMPADTPLFEQLVDAEGRVLRSSHGIAHVPGFNAARAGTGTKCVGCHAGHSAIAVPVSYLRAKWVNAAPSAAVSASSVAPGGAGARAAVDRRARGRAAEVAWIAAAESHESLRLAWPWPIEVRAVVLHPPARDAASGTALRIERCEVLLSRAGVEVGRLSVPRPLAPGGTRIACDPMLVDAVEIRPLRVRGRVEGRRAAALAEVEVDARMVEK